MLYANYMGLLLIESCINADTSTTRSLSQCITFNNLATPYPHEKNQGDTLMIFCEIMEARKPKSLKIHWKLNLRKIVNFFNPQDDPDLSQNLTVLPFPGPPTQKKNHKELFILFGVIAKTHRVRNRPTNESTPKNNLLLGVKWDFTKKWHLKCLSRLDNVLSGWNQWPNWEQNLKSPLGLFPNIINSSPWSLQLPSPLSHIYEEMYDWYPWQSTLD